MVATLRAIINCILCISLLSACSSSDKHFEHYTVSGVANSLEAPVTVGIAGGHRHQIAPEDRSFSRFSFNIPKGSSPVEGLAILEQPESQICMAGSTVDDELSTIDLTLYCQSYRYGPDGVSDFAVSGSRTCAAIGSSVKCWGEFNGDSQIDFSAEYSNPRLLALSWDGIFCFLDDANLHCSNDELFDPSEVYQNASNIREMEMGFDSLCYIDDNGVSCLGGSSIFSPPADLDSPSNLSMSSFDACVLDADGKPHCWGPHAFTVDFSDEVFETIAVSEYDICGYGSDGVKCSLSRFRYWDDELQARIGTVVDFVLTKHNRCAISLSGPICWDKSFPSEALVFENIFAQPAKVEYSLSNDNKGCGLEDEQLICFGHPREVDID